MICWLNRNGFYYILDRLTGEFLHVAPFVELNWASGLTPAGCPILTETAKVRTSGQLTKPGVDGGTNWQNPAFDQKRGLIFVPATLGTSIFTKLTTGQSCASTEWILFGQQFESDGAGDTRGPRARRRDRPAKMGVCNISRTRMQWSFIYRGRVVFGAADGAIFALDAETGREVWRLPLGGNTIPPPISFAVDGRQVIAITAGRDLFMFGL